jgi:hypothetical protein
MARALAVQDYLDLQGVAVWRVFCISYGSDQPAVQGVTPDANALNNRVELIAFLQPEGIQAPQPVAETDAKTPAAAAPAQPPPAEPIP